MDKFEQAQRIEISEDVFGEVYGYDDPLTSEILFMKKLDLEKGISSTQLQAIAIFRELTHQNIVRIQEMAVEDCSVYFTMEPMPWDLSQYMHTKFSPDEVKTLLYQIIKGVAYYHVNGLAHQQVRPENIRVDMSHLDKNNWKVKIADLRLANLYGLPPTRKEKGFLYLAPEILAGMDHGLEADIWSLGCLFAEMAIGTPLFSGPNEVSHVLQIFSRFGAPGESLWSKSVAYWGVDFKSEEFNPKGLRDEKLGLSAIGEDGLDLLSQMLKMDPEERISAKDALNHAYFNDIRAANS